MKKIIAFFQALHWQGIVPHFPNWGEEKWVFGPASYTKNTQWQAYKRRQCQHPGCFETLSIESWEKPIDNSDEWVRLYPQPRITMQTKPRN